MIRFETRLLAGVFALAAACGPTRTFVNDTGPGPDEGVVDTGVADAMDAAEAGDAARDVRDVADVREAGTCDAEACDRMCTMAGAVVGVCREGACQCIGLPDVMEGGMGEGGTDGGDVAIESSITGCMTNADCPPTMFCSGSSCMGPGFCDFRRESDAAACGTEGPPSCGCDGVLYPNVCARTVAGVRQNPAGCAVDAGMDAARD
jgi:hypothetical protein